MMPRTTRFAREEEALRQQAGSHLPATEPPDARGMGAESAEYLEPNIDPQWLDAYKMFKDEKGYYGIPTRVPRGQWGTGGPNALVNLFHSDGHPWFTLVRPERILGEGDLEPKYACFVGTCQKRLRLRIDLVPHVRGHHSQEAITHRKILDEIEAKVGREDPRLQALLASLAADDEPEVG